MMEYSGCLHHLNDSGVSFKKSHLVLQYCLRVGFTYKCCLQKLLASSGSDVGEMEYIIFNYKYVLISEESLEENNHWTEPIRSKQGTGQHPQIPPPCLYSSPELENMALESKLLSFIGKFTILPVSYDLLVLQTK